VIDVKIDSEDSFRLFEADDAAPVQPPSVSKEQLAEKQHETRENVITELYSTEKDYCACLDLCLRTFFAAPLPQPGPLSAEDMETLFGHVEDVMTLSQRLIDQLETDAVGHPFDEQIVGGCVSLCARRAGIGETYRNVGQCPTWWLPCRI